MSVIVVTAPEPILDAATVRANLGVAASTSDDTITGWIASATQAIDGPSGWLNRAIGVQTLELQLPSFPCDRWYGSWRHHHSRTDDRAPEYGIELPYPEVISIKSVVYVDPDGSPQTLGDDQYVLVDRRLVPAVGTPWPAAAYRAGAVKVQYQAGYATVPEIIKQAVTLSISQTRSMFGRDPMLTVDTVYGVGSQQFAANAAAGFSNVVQSMLEPFRVIA